MSTVEAGRGRSVPVSGKVDVVLGVEWVVFAVILTFVLTMLGSVWLQSVTQPRGCVGSVALSDGDGAVLRCERVMVDGG